MTKPVCRLIKMVELVIPGRLPGLNEYTAACRTHPQAGAKMKKEAEEKVISCIIEQRLQGLTASFPVEIEFDWIEKDRRRDPDNISGFGRKVILDALVKTGVIQDDSGKYIKGFKDCFDVYPLYPRIEVFIKGVR